ncbi:hypothetical protein AAF712_015247 [Marasmius tenuissimus]|uniref:F-box domain-containing protein n=1 Tax=Marasmius tenuissimus TaxID=585030 RepID=A0ABR2ZA35_9AGAR
MTLTDDGKNFDSSQVAVSRHFDWRAYEIDFDGSSITRLPLEILAEIFGAMEPTTTYSAIRKRGRIIRTNVKDGVCKTWREVWLSQPRLWSRIELEVGGKKCGRKWSDIVAQHLERHVKRTNRVALNIKVSLLAEAEELELATCPPVLRQVLDHVSRWETLRIDLGGNTELVNPHLFSIVQHLGDMTSLRFLEVEGLGNRARPWMTIMKTLVDNLPTEAGRERLDDLTGVCLLSAEHHRDTFLNDMTIGSPFSSNVTYVHAHVAPRVARKILGYCPAMVRAEFELTTPREKVAVPENDQTLVHQRLLHLTVKTKTYMQWRIAGFFPHATFAGMLDQTDFPSLLSLTLAMDSELPDSDEEESEVAGVIDEAQEEVEEAHERELADCSEDSVDNEGAQKDWANVHANEQANDQEDQADQEDEEDEEEYDSQDDEEYDSQDDVSYGKFFLKCSDAGETNEAYFPDTIKRFLQQKPSLRSLVLENIPLHSCTLTDALTHCTNLADLTIIEVEVTEQDSEAFPAPLPTKRFLEWLQDNVVHLPLLRHLDLGFARLPILGGVSIERVLKVRSGDCEERGRGLKWAGLRCGRKGGQAVHGEFDREQLDELRNAGLAISVWYYGCKDLLG